MTGDQNKTQRPNLIGFVSWIELLPQHLHQGVKNVALEAQLGHSGHPRLLKGSLQDVETGDPL